MGKCDNFYNFSSLEYSRIIYIFAWLIIQEYSMSKTDKIKHKKVKGERMEYRSISLPTSLAEDLAILRECYEDVWFPVKEEEGPRKKRKAVSYEKVFERLLSKSGLGHVDPDVYQEYLEVRKTRKEFHDVVKRATRKTVEELAARAEENGTARPWVVLPVAGKGLCL